MDEKCRPVGRGRIVKEVLEMDIFLYVSSSVGNWKGMWKRRFRFQNLVQKLANGSNLVQKLANGSCFHISDFWYGSSYTAYL